MEDWGYDDWVSEQCWAHMTDDENPEILTIEVMMIKIIVYLNVSPDVYFLIEAVFLNTIFRSTLACMIQDDPSNISYIGSCLYI